MEKLNILWTSDSLETLESLLAPYTGNAIKNGWWQDIHVVIWGGSTKLVADSEKAQKAIKKMITKGVTFEACRYCSDKYKATEILKELDVKVKYMGKGLTDYIKSDVKFLSI